ncbi:MAG: hypothetical protein U5L96_14535 [Owenweeksia sp.]|nr:hypothetical protein [Owenweeksia sp.]
MVRDSTLAQQENAQLLKAYASSGKVDKAFGSSLRRPVIPMVK